MQFIRENTWLQMQTSLTFMISEILWMSSTIGFAVSIKLWMSWNAWDIFWLVTTLSFSIWRSIPTNPRRTGSWGGSRDILKSQFVVTKLSQFWKCNYVQLNLENQLRNLNHLDLMTVPSDSFKQFTQSSFPRKWMSSNGDDAPHPNIPVQLVNSSLAEFI